MEEIITYLLKSSGLMATFFIAYYFLLRKETFFTSNRWFLLSGLFASILLPLFFITKIVYVESPKVNVSEIKKSVNDEIVNNPISISEVTSTPIETIDWTQIMMYGYGIITLFLFFHLIINAVSLLKLLRNQQIEKQNNLSYININQNVAPFSFFNYIVFNSSLYSQKELESILLHEKIHSQEKHSIDVLIAQFFTIVFWFNPIIWLYKKAMIQNLEYIADSKAIQNIEDKKCYQMALLKVVTHQNCLPITNNFYQSLIKKRIVMLNKNQSNKRNIWKYTLILPVIIAFVFLFQIKVEAQEKNVVSVEAIAVSYVLDKNSTDAEIQEDVKMLKEQQDIDYKVSNLKRNSKGEIIAIKIEFEDKKGNIGTTIQNNGKPIDPIHFTADIDKNGKGKIGFFEFIPSKTENNFLAAVFNKDESNLVIDEKLQIFNEEGVTFKKVKTKRNSNNEIISIQISGKSKNDKYDFDVTSDEPIDEIYLVKGYGKSSKLIISEKKNFKTAFAKNKTVTVEEVEVDDIEQAKRDEEQAKLDIEQAKRDLEQGKLDIEQAQRDLEQSKIDLEQSKRDIEQSKRDLEQTKRKTIIFSNDNGDDIVFIPSEKSLKLPSYPSIRLNNDGLVLIVNGVQKSNPLETLNQMDLQNVKSVRVYDENGKETPGSQTKKIVIKTK